MSFFSFCSSCFSWPFSTRRRPGPTRLPVLILLLTAGALWIWLSRPEAPENGPLTIQQVRALAELVTSSIEVSDVRESRVTGRLGGTQAILIVKGRILMGVDLERARLASVDPNGRSARLLLPQPHVISVELDHERSRIVTLGPYGLWTMVPWRTKDQQVVNRAYFEAQQAMERAASDPGLRQQAREHAQDVLGRFSKALHWQLTIEWLPAEEP